MTYDPVANSAGDRLKSIDAAVQAAKPCPGALQDLPRLVPADLQRPDGADELSMASSE